MRRRDSGKRWQAARFTRGVGVADIQVDTSEVRRMFAVTDQVYNLAVARVINRALMRARTGATREISDKLAIKPQRLIRVRMRIDKASSSNHAGRLRILDNPMSMSRLRIRADQRKGGGVMVAGHGLQVGAFVAAKRGTLAQQVFQRKGPKRLPLRALKITISHVAAQAIRANAAMAMERSGADLEKELEWRINYVAPGSFSLTDRRAAVAAARARMVPA